jgi:hypothetical protein
MKECDNKNILKADLTGVDAEEFVNKLSQSLFLKPWVYINPMYDDGDEFSDVVMLFKDTIILLEVKGNQFNPKNPQRYLREAKKRHGQLMKARRIVEDSSKFVHFSNEYQSFKTNFKNIKEVFLISISTGKGEMEMAFDRGEIDRSEISFDDVTKYLGFYNYDEEIHCFTSSELIFASKYIDTIQDFLWYLQFEKKFMHNSFDTQTEKVIFALVDTHREDIIAMYMQTYYWDEQLNRTGIIDLNKVLGDASLDKADVIMYAASDTRNSFEESDLCKRILKEKEISYLWDSYIENILPKKDGPINRKTREIIEEMSLLPRLTRVIFCKKIKQIHDNNSIIGNMYSMAKGSSALISYSIVDDGLPLTSTKEEQFKYKHSVSAWCKIKYSEKFKHIKPKIENVLLITNHLYDGESELRFALVKELSVNESFCKTII